MLGNRLFKNSIYTVAALSFVGLVPFIFNILVARTFGKDVLGEINIALSFSLIITLFVTNFFGTAGNKFLAEYRGRSYLEPFKFVLLFLLIAPIISLMVIAFILIWKWEYFSSQFSIQPDLLLPLVLYIFFRSYYIILRRLFYGVDLVKSYAIIEIISDLVFFISIGFVVSLNLSHYLIHTYLTGYIFFTTVSFIMLNKKYKALIAPLNNVIPFNYKPVLLDYSKYGFLTMIGTSASTGTGYLSMIFTGYYLSTSEAGTYSSVLAIISILMFLPRLVTQVLLPEFSKLYGAGDYTLIIKTLKYTIASLTVIAILIISPLYFFSESILAIFGPSFSSGSQILRIILPSVFLRIISIPLITFLSGTKYVLYPNIGGVIIFISSVACWYLFVPSLHLIGIAIGYSIGIILGILYLITMVGIKLKKFQLEH
ncbi:MAG: lipopolysaccharide biosynthesis protein [Candidatus Marinimicrobia bacterium]|nr:lipopolysaccharide biosynthesis protein [Candidatus Neomarinimicrobiota bacterium]